MSPQLSNYLDSGSQKNIGNTGDNIIVKKAQWINVQKNIIVIALRSRSTTE